MSSESYHEQQARIKVEALGGAFLKLKSKKGDPDRLLVVMHRFRHTVFNTVILIEMKKLDKTPGRYQLYRHDQLRQKGFRVEVCDDWRQVVEIYENEAARGAAARLPGQGG